MMRVEVTQDDIDKGKPEDGWYCPVALALRQATGEQWYVDSGEMHPKGRLLTCCLNTPPEVSAFVEAFDNEGDVAPFAFELELSAAPAP